MVYTTDKVILPLLSKFQNYSASSKNHSLYSDQDESADFADLIRTMIISIYGILCLGIAFNVIVASMIVNIFRTLKNGLSDVHMFLYILALSMADTLVLLNLPFIIVDMLMNQWPFGDLMCRIHWTVDSVNKILSTFILTALSFDRYLAICHPYRLTCWRTVRSTVICLITCSTLSVLLLAPCYVHTKVRYARDPYSVNGNATLAKCTYNWDDFNDTIFVCSLFVLGYCAPFVMMTYFHVNILKTLKSNQRRMGSARRGSMSNTLTTVGRRMMFVIIFYFFCWTPYWAKTLFIQYAGDSWPESGDWIPILFIVIHILVYANSAVNPLIYGLCNFEIRRQQSKAVSVIKRRKSSIMQIRDIDLQTLIGRTTNNNII